MKRNVETGTGRQLVWHVLCAILLLVAFVCQDSDADGIGSHELYCHDSGSLHSTYGAFTYMDGLTYVYVGRDLVWKTDEYTQAPFFRNNDGSAFTVTVGPKVKEIRYHLFHYAKVSHVYLDDAESLTSIGKYAFSVNSSMELASITIPGKVTHIGEYAFGDCDKVTELVVSKSVTKLEY